MKPYSWIAIICLGTIPLSYGMVSFQTSLSGGYYRDYNQDGHLTVFHDWKVNYTTSFGLETFADFGIDNYFYEQKWKAYLYQFFITVPFDGAFSESHIYPSRIQVGRQLLAEDFEAGMLDGALLPYYFSSDFGLRVFGGGFRANDYYNTEGYRGKIAGASAFFQKWQSQLKFGPTFKYNNDGSSKTFAGAAFQTDIHQLPLSPALFFGKQFDLTGDIDQSFADLQLSYWKLVTTLSYSRLRPDPVVSFRKDFIYRLFSVSPQTSKSVSLLWNVFDDLQFIGKFERTDYTSHAGKEVGTEKQVAMSLSIDRAEIFPSVTLINSWSGDLQNYGCDFRYALSRVWSYALRGDIAKFDKTDGIFGWAYHGETGLDIRLKSRWMLLARAEVERNHHYAFDARGVMYVTHYSF